MTGSWWLLWLVFLLVFLVPSVGYGWGYRRWGPPYPTYIQRRRWQQANDLGGPTTYDHRAWGFGGDFVWMVMFFGVFWAFAALWRR